MKKVNKLGKQLITGLLALLIAFTAVLAVPEVAEAAVKVNPVSNVKTKSASSSSIKITWKKAKGVNGYKIYRAAKKDGKYVEIKNIKNAKTTSFINQKVLTGKTYYYKVRAYKKVSGETKYSKYSKAVKGQALPDQVKEITAKNTSTMVAYETDEEKEATKREATIDWKDAAGATGYEVYRQQIRTVSGKTRVIANYKKVGVTTKSIYKDKLTKVISYGGEDAHDIFRYKVRGYKVVKGKKIYGKFSKVVETDAFNEDWTHYNPDDLWQ